MEEEVEIPGEKFTADSDWWGLSGSSPAGDWPPIRRITLGESIRRKGAKRHAIEETRAFICCKDFVLVLLFVRGFILDN